MRHFIDWVSGRQTTAMTMLNRFQYCQPAIGDAVATAASIAAATANVGGGGEEEAIQQARPSPPPPARVSIDRTCKVKSDRSKVVQEFLTIVFPSPPFANHHATTAVDGTTIPTIDDEDEDDKNGTSSSSSSLIHHHHDHQTHRREEHVKEEEQQQRRRASFQYNDDSDTTSISNRSSNHQSHCDHDLHHEGTMTTSCAKNNDSPRNNIHASINNNNNNECHRTGRKGDPRMHKAVSARLADPNLSLYHALVKGGFDYDGDNDPGLMDNEKVTLGQRKNQLSRRLRLAKKTHHGSHHISPTGTKRKLSSTGGGTDRHDMSDDPALTNATVLLAPSDVEHSARSLAHRDHQPQYQQQLRVRHHNPHCARAATNAVSSLSSSSPGTATVVTTASAVSSGSASQKAVSDLTDIAGSIGLTLDQLASALGNHRQLAQALKGSFRRHELALAFYRNHLSRIRTEAMLQAGYPVEIATDDTCDDYHAFARAAWEEEGRHLQQQEQHQQQEVATTHAHNASNHKDGGNHHHHHINDSSKNPPPPPPTKRPRSSSFASSAAERHLHSNRCGHQAILHQPANGPAHIDFVVGNRVECYQGVPTLPASIVTNGHAHSNITNNNGNHIHGNEAADAAANQNQNTTIRVWPSKYKCEDSHCAEECEKVKTADSNVEECVTIAAAAEPKILNLDDLDVDGGEWIMDFTNDPTMLGLFKWPPLSEGRAGTTTDGEDSDAGGGTAGTTASDAIIANTARLKDTV
jgi:hypothetical protein